MLHMLVIKLHRIQVLLRRIHHHLLSVLLLSHLLSFASLISCFLMSFLNTDTVLLYQLMESLQISEHMNASASIQMCRFEYP